MTFTFNRPETKTMIIACSTIEHHMKDLSYSLLKTSICCVEVHKLSLMKLVCLKNIDKDNFYHDVDLCFPFLDDESPTQGQTFIRITLFHCFSHACHKTVLSCSLAGSHLYDLRTQKQNKQTLNTSIGFSLLKATRLEKVP